MISHFHLGPIMGVLEEKEFLWEGSRQGSPISNPKHLPSSDSLQTVQPWQKWIDFTLLSKDLMMICWRPLDLCASTLRHFLLPPSVSATSSLINCLQDWFRLSSNFDMNWKNNHVYPIPFSWKTVSYSKYFVFSLLENLSAYFHSLWYKEASCCQNYWQKTAHRGVLASIVNIGDRTNQTCYTPIWSPIQIFLFCLW